MEKNCIFSHPPSLLDASGTKVLVLRNIHRSTAHLLQHVSNCLSIIRDSRTLLINKIHIIFPMIKMILPTTYRSLLWKHSPQCKSSTVSSLSRVPLRAVGRPHTANSLTRNLLTFCRVDIHLMNHSRWQSQTRLFVCNSLDNTVAWCMIYNMQHITVI